MDNESTVSTDGSPYSEEYRLLKKQYDKVLESNSQMVMRLEDAKLILFQNTNELQKQNSHLMSENMSLRAQKEYLQQVLKTCRLHLERFAEDIETQKGSIQQQECCLSQLMNQVDSAIRNRNNDLANVSPIKEDVPFLNPLALYELDKQLKSSNMASYYLPPIQEVPCDENYDDCREYDNEDIFTEAISRHRSHESREANQISQKDEENNDKENSKPFIHTSKLGKRGLSSNQNRNATKGMISSQEQNQTFEIGIPKINLKENQLIENTIKCFQTQSTTGNVVEKNHKTEMIIKETLDKSTAELKYETNMEITSECSINVNSVRDGLSDSRGGLSKSKLVTIGSMLTESDGCNIVEAQSNNEGELKGKEHIVGQTCTGEIINKESQNHRILESEPNQAQKMYSLSKEAHNTEREMETLAKPNINMMSSQQINTSPEMKYITSNLNSQNDCIGKSKKIEKSYCVVNLVDLWRSAKSKSQQDEIIAPREDNTLNSLIIEDNPNIPMTRLNRDLASDERQDSPDTNKSKMNHTLTDNTRSQSSLYKEEGGSKPNRVQNATYTPVIQIDSALSMECASDVFIPVKPEKELQGLKNTQGEDTLQWHETQRNTQNILDAGNSRGRIEQTILQKDNKSSGARKAQCSLSNKSSPLENVRGSAHGEDNDISLHLEISPGETLAKIADETYTLQKRYSQRLRNVEYSGRALRRSHANKDETPMDQRASVTSSNRESCSSEYKTPTKRRKPLRRLAKEQLLLLMESAAFVGDLNRGSPRSKAIVTRARSKPRRCRGNENVAQIKSDSEADLTYGFETPSSQPRMAKK